VLFFYPLDFTFVCPTEIISFSNAAETLRGLGAEVIGASVDSEYTHLAFTKTPVAEGGIGKVDIPLLADVNKTVSTAYGALLGSTGHTLRATYIIDGNQNLRHLSFNDAPVGRNVDEVIRLVQGFQFNDKHGEVCPAAWKPGSRTIKPDPTQKLEYFGGK